MSRTLLTAGGVLAPPLAPTISGAPSIGQPMTITAGGGGPTSSYTLYRDGVSAGTVSSGYTYVAADCCNALTVQAVGPGGTSADSNVLGQTDAGVFSDANYFQSAAGSLAGMDLGSGTTLVVVLNPLDVDNITHDWSPICYRNPSAVGTKGWGLYLSANGDAPKVGMYYIAASAVLVTNLGSLSRVPGRPVRIVFVDDGTSFRVSVNGSPIVTAARATYAAGDSSVRATLGNFLGSAGFQDAHDKVTSFAILHRAVTDNEAIAESGLVDSWAIGLSTDAQCTVQGHATRDYSGGASWVTGGTSPVTLVKQGTVTSQATSGIALTRVALTRPDDTGIWTAVTAAGASIHKVTNEARWTIDTDSETLVVRQVANEGSPYFTQLAIRKDGTAQTPITNGPFASACMMSGYFALGSGGTAKVVQLVAAAQSVATPGTVTTPVGGFPFEVYVPSGRSCSVRAATAPTRRLVAWVDSIGCGEKASAPALLGPFGLARTDYPGQITIDGAVSLSFFDALAGLGQSALVAQLAAECDGSVTNEIWLQVSTNDFGLGSPSGQWSSLPTMTTQLNAFLVALRAAVPSAAIFLQTMGVRTDITTNGQGQTIAAFRTAWAAAASGVSNCTVVDGATMYSSSDLDADGAHLTTAGCAVFKAAIKAAIGY